MKSSTNLIHVILRPFKRLAPIALLALAPYAQAAWTLAQADAPVTVIHETGRYQAETGQRLALDDIVETPSDGGVQIQDDMGNSVALGHDTRVLLTRDSHIALLGGWVKVLHTCGTNTPDCVVPVVETARTRFTPSDDTALVIEADPQNADSVFCESGSASVLGINGSRGFKAAPIKLDAHRFATHPASGDAIPVSPRPEPAFVAAMPVTFRDALRVLPTPAQLHNDPPNTIQPVTYDDISDWLTSGLAARRDPSTRFTARFRPRLSDAAFRRAIVQHIRDLPDWRPLVFPPPAHAVIRSAYRSNPPLTSVRP